MSNLLPPNATTLELNLDEAFSRIESVPTPARNTANPDKAPTEILPWMAWAQSVDNWDIGWTEEQKRAVIKAAYSVHKQKGTMYALRVALEALGYDLVVQEWYQQMPQGDPYTFDVLLTVKDNEISDIAFNKILNVIIANKNLRSHLSRIRLIVSSSLSTFFSAVAVCGIEINFSKPAAILLLDGTWVLDGSKELR